MAGKTNIVNPEENKNTDLKVINPVTMLFESDIIRKSDIDAVADLIVDKAFEETNGHAPLVVFEAMKKVCEKVNERLRHEMELKGTVTVKGVRLEEAPIARTFDYSVDGEWLKLNEARKAREALLKQQYQIKTNPLNFGKDVPGIVEEGGEELPLIEVKSGGGVTVKVTFPK